MILVDHIHVVWRSLSWRISASIVERLYQPHLVLLGLPLAGLQTLALVLAKIEIRSPVAAITHQAHAIVEGAIAKRQPAIGAVTLQTAGALDKDWLALFVLAECHCVRRVLLVFAPSLQMHRVDIPRLVWHQRAQFFVALLTAASCDIVVVAFLVMRLVCHCFFLIHVSHVCHVIGARLPDVSRGARDFCLGYALA